MRAVAASPRVRCEVLGLVTEAGTAHLLSLERGRWCAGEPDRRHCDARDQGAGRNDSGDPLSVPGQERAAHERGEATGEEQDLG